MVVVLSLGSALRLESAQAQEEVSGPALDDEARALFEAGRVAYSDGRYDAALEYFERAYALSPRPGLQYNLGLAYDRLRRDREALEAFRTFVAVEPDSERAQEAQNRIRALEASLARAEQGSQGPQSSASPRTTEREEPVRAAPALTVGEPTHEPPVDARPERSRRRWLWVGVAASVVVLGVAGVASWAATRDREEERPEPNSRVVFTVNAWRP